MTDQGLPTRVLGRTGLAVTRIGYGAMSLDSGRFAPVSDAQAEAVLTAVLDAGINFIDTAPDYGESEERIGRFIGHRRAEFLIATKVGCPVAVAPGPNGEAPHAYTRENIVAGVEQSLRRMRTDTLDVVQFHGSPSRRTLEREGAIETLRELQRQGKVRFIGVSATLPEVDAHLAMGVFDTFQVPYSALQREHEAWITKAAQAGAGTVIRGGAVRGGPSPEKQWAVRRLPEVAPGAAALAVGARGPRRPAGRRGAHGVGAAVHVFASRPAHGDRRHRERGAPARERGGAAQGAAARGRAGRSVPAAGCRGGGGRRRLTRATAAARTRAA